MSQKNRMPIREFSRLTGIKTDNLRFYDRVGLLSPAVRGENGYRYYTRQQLASAYLIATLRDLGVGLEEIRNYSAQRTPEKMLALFAQQDKRIRLEIERLRDMREIMSLYSHMAREALTHTDGAFLLEERPREPIFLCPPIPAEAGEDEGELLAYEYAGSQGLNLSYPFCVRVEQAALTGADTPSVRYYFKARRGCNAWKPAGLYAVAYGRCGLRQSESLYHRLLEFIGRQGLAPWDGTYGECLLNEMAVQDADQYGVRIEVPVTQA